MRAFEENVRVTPLYVTTIPFAVRVNVALAGKAAWLLPSLTMNVEPLSSSGPWARFALAGKRSR